MRNFYATIGDIEITYDSFIEKAGERLLPVQLKKLEGKTVAAFAGALAPSCELVLSEGFDEFELEALRSLLQRNLPLLWDDALEAVAS